MTISRQEEAPSNSLPSWEECRTHIHNTEYINENGLEPTDYPSMATPLHYFIYEYDDSDAYKSAWFMHRLEKLIKFIESEAASDNA